MTTIAELQAKVAANLRNLYPKGEIEQFIFFMLENVCNYSRTDIIAFPEKGVNNSDIEKVEKMVLRLKNMEPIQHIIGYADFYDLKFKVNSDVLIPRPETEELVHWIMESGYGDDIRVLDIGTGSGAIPISIKANRLGWKVSSVDVSTDAIAVAKENAVSNKVDVNFLNDDALSGDFMSNGDMFDIVVSNPPYVRNLEKEDMEANVLDWEPHLALFVDDNDPLIFYKKIAEWAIGSLNAGGALFFEINRAFGKETIDMLSQMGYRNIELRKDLSGNDRMVKACK